ncbi:hypothetical protein [Planctomicrobium sp. SH664]|uniref:hypothetical protein n=1 Tax=Planctomicrobium sp. SH664 TaxID=3448125 RepID=UPI003F5B3E0A
MHRHLVRNGWARLQTLRKTDPGSPCPGTLRRTLLACMLGVSLSSCNSKTAPPTPTPTAVEATAATPAKPVEPVAPERKWIGNIPYDVFYDQPLVIAADETRLQGSSATSAPVTLPSASPATTNAMPVASPSPAAPPASTSPQPASPDWAKILPMPLLVEEVKLLRTRLTSNLQTVATFNKGAAAISQDAAVLAALATIVTTHPESVSWKPNAHHIRELAHQLSVKSSGSGREAYNGAKEPFEKLTVILDGGPPPEETVAATIPPADAVDLSDLMKRTEITFNFLKSNINTEARLKEKPADCERELRLLAAFGTLMTDKSYADAEEEKYQALAKRFTSAAAAGADASKSERYSEFQAALNQMQTSCAECHQEFRSGGAGF